MLCVQHEHHDWEVLSAQTVQQAQAQEAEAAGALLFPTTLLDDPSIHNSTCSNQAPPNSASSDDSSVQAIITSVQCIALSPEATITGVEEEFHQLLLKTPCSSISEHTSSPISHSPASNQQPTESSSSKVEWSQYTKTVLAQLSHIESNFLSSTNDLIGIPSPEKIAKINQLVTTWHKVLALINWDLPVVKTHKNSGHGSSLSLRSLSIRG